MFMFSVISSQKLYVFLKCIFSCIVANAVDIVVVVVVTIAAAVVVITNVFL